MELKGIDDALVAGAEITTLPYRQERPKPEPLVREVEPPKPFPVDHLGPVLAPAAKRMVDVIQAPTALCGQSLLAAAALAVQGFADVVIDGRRRPICNFFVSIGESGERKSAVDAIALRPHRDREEQLTRDHDRLVEEFKKEKAIYDKEWEAALRSQGENRENDMDALGKRPEPPLSPLLIIQEPTYEGLVKLLAVGQPSMGLFTDEGGRLIGGHGMNQEQQLKTAAGFSEMWDGARITRVRAGESASALYGRRVSMHIMAQPSVAQILLANPLLAAQGLLARMLVAWPTSTIGTRQYREENLLEDPAVVRYHDRIDEILKTALPLREGTRNELEPRSLKLDAAAKKEWIEAQNYFENEIGKDGSMSAIRAFGSKAGEQVLRLAAVLTLLDDFGVDTINREKVISANHLLLFYIGEALRLHAAGATDPELTTAGRVLDFVSRIDGGRFCLSRVYQFGPNEVRDSKVARRMVEILEEHHHLVRLPEGTKIDGRVRRESWEVVRD